MFRRSASRPLTANETGLTRSIFGIAVDTGQVRIHSRPYLPGQGRHVAMAPNGHIWFHREDHVADFSLDTHRAAWLIHEMTV